jgi:hypothetical protein
MIGFFRRIRRKLANENQFVKYSRYAIGEVLLVVIGILIALQVNNWNEQRKMDSKEKSFLMAIHEEFLKNKIQLDLALSQHNKALQSCKKLIALFPLDVKTNNLDSIGLYIYNSKNAPTFNPSQGSINSIISTSSFDLIHNNELRNHLISWPDLLTDYQEDEIEARRTLDNLIDPYFSKNFGYNFNLRDKRNKLESLESLEFEYLIRIRHQYILYIIGERSQLPTLTKSINEIIRLSKN